MSGFQTQVYVQPALGIAGDFASVNPRFVALAGPGGFVAGAAGLAVGAFGWAQLNPVDPNGAPTVVNNFGSGPVTGFVAREQQGLIVTYLAAATLLAPVGFGATLYSGGDFLVKNSGTAVATSGMKAYANYNNGLATFAVTGSPATVANSTSSSIAAETASVTASITGNVMAVTAVGSGTLVPGGVLSGTSLDASTSIVSQISGTPGGVGTYAITPPEQTVPSTTVSETYGLLTVGGTVTGTFELGAVLNGTSVSTGSIISGFGTGTGQAGTYYTPVTQTATAGTISATGNVETKWIAMSTALPGEVVKISSNPLG